MDKILPYPRNYIENFDPIYKGLSTNPELKKRLDELGASITNHNKNLLNGTAKSATDKLFARQIKRCSKGRHAPNKKLM